MLRLWKKMTKKSIINIIGTTGVGKSQLSIELAKRFNGEVINTDSMQMYKGLDIITNKHPIKEREGIPHHVMNHVDWKDEYFLHTFEKEALKAIEDIHGRGKIPILVGGTHYYLQSILFHNKVIKTGGSAKDEETSSTLTPHERQMIEGPPEELIGHLKELDPIVAEKFHPNDHRRIRRALEIYLLTKKPASAYYDRQREEERQQSSLRFNTLNVWLYADQTVLDARLDSRVDTMLTEGGLDEIQQLYGYYKSLDSQPNLQHGVWQVIGFKEFITWLNEPSEESLQAAVEQMKARTRQYARRQVKWIKKVLANELLKEKAHGYPNGGQIYILEATNLNQWKENVTSRALEITDAFLEFRHIEQPFASGHLIDLLPQEASSSEKERKKWKHYECDTCKDADGNKAIFVGDQYEIHLASRRHRSAMNKLKKRQEREHYITGKDAMKKAKCDKQESSQI
ncbi:Delta 2-isopentenyl pyrophosphate:tRNA isopentenyl transferase [Komagataella phaffii GS115]|uniref:tRNA dimethylallyltransferase n=1 Tax=Komagataella phaffii (strain GS115 / ATCC 20864) TaxID=644223 RepID=C4QVH5_KOMPG|nr:Delta 2-isopentenyl pyrophosphate:tRNA isopentenyl transferase [Komagataella phaffii GS115]AOA61495.1 GQ67_02440T0 [Komagataella phaffii]AOA65536.1 GQ68_02807T0 [Komagataella phaffii GS115]CAY67248.1 Delta 2-isopentenyl pyrophosphate:tRNA isopentenyl transferase [Komagataella phaffii GS115]